MNQGARDANDERRRYSEQQHREQVIELLQDIRDLLAALVEEVKRRS